MKQTSNLVKSKTQSYITVFKVVISEENFGTFQKIKMLHNGFHYRVAFSISDFISERKIPGNQWVVFILLKLPAPRGPLLSALSSDSLLPVPLALCLCALFCRSPHSCFSCWKFQDCPEWTSLLFILLITEFLRIKLASFLVNKELPACFLKSAPFAYVFDPIF